MVLSAFAIFLGFSLRCSFARDWKSGLTGRSPFQRTEDFWTWFAVPFSRLYFVSPDFQSRAGQNPRNLSELNSAAVTLPESSAAAGETAPAGAARLQTRCPSPGY